MDPRQAVEASKYLSYLLRHDPASAGLVPDAAGWVPVADVLRACEAHGIPLDRATLAAVVRASDKQRFALSADGERIRAQQGHTISVALGHPPAQPPEYLYHGTTARALAAIARDGLLKQRRQQVHLSATTEVARAVGARRGPPVLLTVHARAMADEGHLFYCTPNGVWLTDHVPPAFVRFPTPER